MTDSPSHTPLRAGSPPTAAARGCISLPDRLCLLPASTLPSFHPHALRFPPASSTTLATSSAPLLVPHAFPIPSLPLAPPAHCDFPSAGAPDNSVSLVLPRSS